MHNDIYTINELQEFIQETSFNRHCTMDITAPQIFELIINISIPNVISILPSITCIGVLGMEKDLVFSANTVDLTLIPTNNPSKRCLSCQSIVKLMYRPRPTF